MALRRHAQPQVSLARTLSQHQSSELRAQRGTDLAAYDAAWLAMLNGLAAARGVYPKPLEGLGLLANGGAKVGLEPDGGVGARRGSLNGYKAGLGLEKGLAACVADVPLLPLAPWNRKPGHLVRHSPSLHSLTLLTMLWMRGDRMLWRW